MDVTASADRDRLDLLDLLHRYADGYDTRDDEAVGRCYTTDARFSSVTPSGDQRVFDGVEAICDNARNTFKSCPHQRRHLITNELLAIDGDTATSSCYLTLLEITDAGVATLLTGRYLDRLVRTTAGWRIAERTLHADVGFSIPPS